LKKELKKLLRIRFTETQVPLVRLQVAIVVLCRQGMSSSLAQFLVVLLNQGGVDRHLWRGEGRRGDKLQIGVSFSCAHRLEREWGRYIPDELAHKPEKGLFKVVV
jgi:hypothetical protein